MSEPEETPSMEAYIHAEDPRYPMLVIRYNRGIYGLEINPVTGDIDPLRRCICSARCDCECCCTLS